MNAKILRYVGIIAVASCATAATPELVHHGEARGGAMPGALVEGTLELDEEGCLVLLVQDGEQLFVFQPWWPPGYTIVADSGNWEIVDDRGQVVAEVGDAVTLGGGTARAETPVDCEADFVWLTSWE